MEVPSRRGTEGRGISGHDRLALLKKEKEHLERQIQACCEVDESLLQLPKTLKKKVMVPLGQLAFVPGVVEQTNEVMVLLGANHFALRSSFQAREILARRKEKLETSLEKITTAIEESTGIGNKITEKNVGFEVVDDEQPVHIHETFEESEMTLNVPKQKSKFEPLPAEKHLQMIARLEELERLESMNKPSTDSGNVNTSSSNVFNGTIQERNTTIGSRKHGQGDAPKQKKKISLFKQQRMNQMSQ